METLFVGGPMDGEIVELPPDARIWVVYESRPSLLHNDLEKNGQLTIPSIKVSYSVRKFVIVRGKKTQALIDQLVVMDAAVAFAPGWEDHEGIVI